jgi:hypothetical protein
VTGADSPCVQYALSFFPNAKKKGTSWFDHCPVHTERTPSFHISAGADGRALFKCHGCGAGFNEVVAAKDMDPAMLFPEGSKKNSDGAMQIVAVYDYRDEKGELLSQSVRFENPKDFRQRQPCDRSPDGWLWKMSGVRRVPYNLPGVKAAIAAGEIVWCPEGEKDCDNLAQWGLVATTNSGGAKVKWTVPLAECLTGARVVILPDNDESGKEHAKDKGARLSGYADEVRVLELPDLGPKGDVSDWIAAGGTKEKLLDMAAAAPLFNEWEGSGLGLDTPTLSVVEGRTSSSQFVSSSSSGEQPKEKGNQAAHLVRLAQDSGAEFYHTPGGELFARVPVAGHFENVGLRSRHARNWLQRLFWNETRKPPGGQAMQDALGVLQGLARFDGPCLPVWTRIAELGETVYIDLGSDRWDAIEIDSAGWRVNPVPPVRFRRADGLLPLPHPISGGSVEDLRPFVNVSGDDWYLLVGWTLQALNPRGPYPVLIIKGEQGSAKSTQARLVRSLVDPNAAPLRVEPKDARDLAIASRNSHVQAYDNVSGIPGWLSDALCRLSTGGGFSTKRNYTDDEETLIDSVRPSILTGIGEIATREDLIDRSLILDLPLIFDGEYRTEREFWETFERARPKILGAFLGAVSAAIRNRPHTKLDVTPRMADFAMWVTAGESALGWEAGTFLTKYTGNREEANALALESSVIGALVQAFAKQHGPEWKGTATDLRAELESLAGEKVPKRNEWPKDARALSSALRRVAPALRKEGLSVVFSKEGHDKKRFITLTVQT